MKTPRYDSKAIRDALPFVALSDLPAEHKSVVMEVIAQALKEYEVAERAGRGGNKVGPWDTEEVQLITAQLEGKSAASWQHADELLTDLALRLKRLPSEVKEKSIELGFATAVDYRAAREQIVRENA